MEKLIVIPTITCTHIHMLFSTYLDKLINTAYTNGTLLGENRSIIFSQYVNNIYMNTYMINMQKELD
jgi:hypothetical protein